jgi:excinuclease ABC subunit B
MRRSMGETGRRRTLQLEYNREHGITPQTIEKEIRRGVEEVIRARKVAAGAVRMDEKEFDRAEGVAELEKEMFAAAERLEFERAAELRDAIRKVTGEMAPAVGGPRRRGRPRGARITWRA